MKYLSLDVGTRRTGLAFFESTTAIVLPLDTLLHQSADELAQQVLAITQSRGIDLIVLGLPLLPSGAEGSQVAFVRSCADLLTEHGLRVAFQDERYTTQRQSDTDGDARAACELLRTYLHV